MSWMRQYKLAEYLSGHFPNLKAAERWIYFAVIRGDIRAQFRNGEILGPAWPEIDHFVMAITAAEAIVRHAAPHQTA